MNPSFIEPPPTQRGMGCFAKGFLILLAFFAFLLCAGVAGTFIGVRFLKSAYFPTTRIPLPAVSATQEEQDQARTHWDEFERAARSHSSAHLEMTANELNALIASNPELRGKALVSIENNVAHLRLSIPLEHVSWLRGRYVNAECTVQSAENGNPAEVHIGNILINDKPVEDETLNWRGPWSLRRYLENWTDQRDLKTFEIRDGRIILETKGKE